MARVLPISMAQVPQIEMEANIEVFHSQVREILNSFPETKMLVFPELHLFGAIVGQPSDSQLRESAKPINGKFVKELLEIASDFSIWLIPGSICESGEKGELFNTALICSPQGRLTATYRKIFPWRPFEPYTPGDKFVVTDLPNIGRIGLSICYDTWFPEVSRHLAWMGAEVIVNLVKTTTSDRAQEIILTRANAIANQVFIASINCAGPIGTGQSLVVDPEGRVRVASSEAGTTVLTDVLDLDSVAVVRQFGTAGLNRMWEQFRATDAQIDLPLYQGRINPASWTPKNKFG